MFNLKAKFLVLAILQALISVQVFGENGAGGTDNILQDFYDFVIVGGGTSGCVLANRLSEKFSVLVLEEGGFPPEEFDIPANVMSLYPTSPAVKHYFTIHQKNAGLGSKNGRVEFMIGKTLGGGSSVNGMVFNRGSPHDYDNWAKVTGDSSWNYENLMKYFKKIEDYHGNFPMNSDQHGNGGFITISQSKYAPGFEALMEAGEFYGYTTRKDPNGPQVPSFTPLEFSKRFGHRVSAFTGYIKPILKTRPQLTIVTGARVHRIIFDSSNKRAIGVTFMSTKQKDEIGASIDTMDIKYVGASKEVIVSAGAIDSPAILMRSGIGPQDVLETSKIPEVKILPVGHNLHDHVLLWIDFLVDRNTPAGVFIPEVDLNPETWKEYLETGDGPYSSMKGMHAQALWVSSRRLNENWPNPEWVDIHLLQSQVATNFKPEDELINIYTRPYLTRPKSRGRVILNSSDVDAMPLFDFQYLSDLEGHDMEILLEAVKLTVKIYENAPSYQAQGCRLRPTQDKNCDGGNFVFGSDEYWKCVISHKAQSGIHAGGSCRMGTGNGEDPEAVVDTRLKVIGMEGLRVVDMSVVPQVTNTNTMAVAYVIAEKAAEMIKEDWFSECNKMGMTNGGEVGSGDELHYCF